MGLQCFGGLTNARRVSESQINALFIYLNGDIVWKPTPVLNVSRDEVLYVAHYSKIKVKSVVSNKVYLGFCCCFNVLIL